MYNCITVYIHVYIVSFTICRLWIIRCLRCWLVQMLQFSILDVVVHGCVRVCKSMKSSTRMTFIAKRCQFSFITKINVCYPIPVMFNLLIFFWEKMSWFKYYETLDTNLGNHFEIHVLSSQGHDRFSEVCIVYQNKHFLHARQSIDLEIISKQTIDSFKSDHFQQFNDILIEWIAISICFERPNS